MISLTLYIFFQNHCTILLGTVDSEYESGNSNKYGSGTMRGVDITASLSMPRIHVQKSKKKASAIYKLPSKTHKSLRCTFPFKKYLP